MSPNPAARPDRDIARLAGRLAGLHGYITIVGHGAISWPDLALSDPNLNLIEIVDSSRQDRQSWPRRTLIQTSAARSQTIGPEVMASGVLVDVDLSERRTGASIGEYPLAAVSEAAVAIVVRPGGPDELRAELGRGGVRPTFDGSLAPTSLGESALAIVDQRLAMGTAAVPDSFRILAIVTAFNEEDVIGGTLRSLIDEGIDVHVIDNWSTDRTHDIAAGFLGRGLVGLERYPASASATYDWATLLRRVETIAADTPSDWYIHHDSDERHRGPWPGRSLRESIWTVDQSGFNAIDHTVLNFRPIDDNFSAGDDLESAFPYFEFGATAGDLHRIKAWRSTPVRVFLAASGGHEVEFPGRRVFPYKFLLKHYPIRSQAHGERKVLRERQARWNAAERAKGWHVHYDDVGAAHDFLRQPGDLIQFEDRTLSDYLVPIISGIGLASDPVPGWATRGHAAATIFGLGRSLASSRGVSALGGSRVARSIGRLDAARRLKRRLVGGGP